MPPASPATTRPVRKVSTPISSGRRAPTRSASSPAATMPITEVTSRAVNDQPYQARPRSSATAVGSAVATAIASNAMRLTSPTMPSVATRRPGARTPPAPGSAVGSVRVTTRT